MTDRLDPATRQRVTSAGGQGRAAALTPEQRAAIASAGAAASRSPAALARRIVKAWPDLSRAERAEVREILAPIMRAAGGPKSERRARSADAKA